MSVVAVSLKKKPYCLRVTEEQKIYSKTAPRSELGDAACAPATVERLALCTVLLSRRRRHTRCLSEWSSDVCSSDQIFFSSRRRHTRCLSDWSSDVCSSDLDGRDVPRL